MFGDIKNENKAYTYTLFAPGKGKDRVEVTGRLPQEWLLSTGSTWDGNASGDTIKELSANSGTGIIGSGASLATTVGGSNVGFTALANRQWSGGKPLTFNLLAEFNAYNNALEDVMRPLVLMQSMSMPTALGNPSIDLAGGTLSAGDIIGPPYWEDAKDSGQVGGRSTILLRIGNMFVFDDIVVEDVNPTMSMRLADPGIPIKSQIEFQASTRGPITFQQYVKYMTGEAFAGFFGNNDSIQAAREGGAGQRSGYSGMNNVPPTK